MSTSTEIAFRLSLADLCEAREEALAAIRSGAEQILAGTKAARRAAPTGGFVSILDESTIRSLLYSSDELDRFMGKVRENLDRAMWWHVLRASELADVMPAKAKEKFERDLKDHVPEVTLDNLRATLQTMIGNAQSIIAEGVVDLFRALSDNHKTNDRFKIGKKFIIQALQPEQFNMQSFGYGWAADHLVDLERQLHVITGRKIPAYNETIKAKMQTYGLTTEPRVLETELLRVKWHKRGTVHAEIKDPEHVAIVNRIIAEHYGEVLPEGHDARPGRGRQQAPAPKPIKETAIAADVLDVLRKGRVEGNLYFLAGQLERRQYEAVNKVLVDLGGRWSRQQRAHVMPEHALEELSALMENGSYTRPADLGQFFTGPDLARKVGELAEIEPGMSLLEPSAGTGNLIKGLPVKPAACIAVEIDARLAEALRANPAIKATVIKGDFIELWQRWSQKFDRVIMNPPYANGAVPDHVTAAWNCLKPGGRLVAILPPAWQSRQDRKHGFLRELVEQFGGTWEDNPAGSFKAAGTDVATGILVLDKPAEGDGA